MHIMKKMIFIGVALVVAAPGTYAAPDDVRVSGFLTAAAAKTTGLKNEPGQEAEHLERLNDDHMDFGDTHFGLNVAASLDDEWSVAGQLYASGAEENFNIILDWAFVSYRPTSNLTANFGKIKFPNALMSEVIDVGLVYPWIRPPQEFYNLELEGPNIVAESFNGATLIWNNDVGDYVVSLQPFIGSITGEGGDNKNDMIGLKLSLGSDSFTAHVSQYSAELEMNTQFWPEAYTNNNNQANGKDIEVMTVGASIDRNNLLALAEYGTSEVDGIEETKTESHYVTLGYRIGKFMPHVTSASVTRNTAEEEHSQKSTTIGLKYQLKPNIALKVEHQKVRPGMNAGGETIFTENAEEEDFSIQSFAIDVVF